jgi:hypothetical protein
MQARLRTGILALLIAVASVGAARADARLTFSPSTMSLAPGGTVVFDGTLTNTGGDLLYLNGDQFNLPYPDLSVDDSPFIFNGPLSLPPGDSWTGAFIDVTADNSISDGSYSGSYTILGGTDPNAFDSLATADFGVNVGEATATPEPNAFLLLATGAMLLAVASSRKSRLTKK